MPSHLCRWARRPAATTTAARAPTTAFRLQADLIERARAIAQHIVLPEPDDDRVHRRPLPRSSPPASPTHAGGRPPTASRAGELGLDLSAAQVVSVNIYLPRALRRKEFAKGRHRAGPKVTDVSTSAP